MKKKIFIDDRGFPYIVLSNKHYLYSDYKGRIWYVNPNSGYSSIVSHYDSNRWACDIAFNKESNIYKEVLSLLNRDIKGYLWNVNSENKLKEE